MRKIFKSFITIAILIVFTPLVKAATLEEETTQYINRINSFALTAEEKIDATANWFKTYKTEFNAILDYDLVDNINKKIQIDSYDEVIILIVTALNNNDYLTAATALNTIDIGEFLNDYIDFKIDLLTFISDNADSMNIDEGTPEGFECLFDIYEAINSAYDTIKPSYTKLLNTTADVFGAIVDFRLNRYQSLSNNELMSLIETYDDLGTIISELVTEFYDSISDYQTVFDDLIDDSDFFLTKFKTKLRTDFKTLLDNCEDKLQAPLNSFISERWNLLRDDVNQVINSSKTVLEKNAYIYDKMDKITGVNGRLDTKITNIMRKINSSIINEFLDDILKRADEELQEAVSYLEDSLVIGEYDIKLIDNPTDDIFINRATEMLVLNNILTTNQLRNNILLANAATGTLDFQFSNSTNVGTKSTVNVLRDNITMKNYVVVVKGDIDANARITITDAIEAAYQALDARTFDDYEFVAADLDNSKSITITDAWEIARKALMQGGNL